jgi:hypothetical protein
MCPKIIPPESSFKNSRPGRHIFNTGVNFGDKIVTPKEKLSPPLVYAKG